MKNLRKSFNSHKEPHISSPLPPLSKPTLTAIQPPLKVIRAILSHRSNSPNQLSFEKGDFFHVINDSPQPGWYEAHNPSTGARGLVQIYMFEEFTKGSALYVAVVYLYRISNVLMTSQTEDSHFHVGKAS